MRVRAALSISSSAASRCGRSAIPRARPKAGPGVFKTIAEAPLGRLLLALVGTGLAAFGISRVLEAILIMRTRLAETWLAQSAGLIHAIVNGTLALFAFWIALDPTVERRGKAAEWAAPRPRAAGRPLAPWLDRTHHRRGRTLPDGPDVSSAPAATLGALSRRLRARSLRAHVFSSRRVCGGRGFFRSPGEARDLGGALGFLQERIYGSLLLALFGCGLIAHGVMSAIEAIRASQETSGRRRIRLTNPAGSSRFPGGRGAVSSAFLSHSAALA